MTDDTAGLNKKSLLIRTLSAIVMIPIPLLAIYFGYPYINLLIIAAGCVVAWEYEHILTSKTGIFSTLISVLVCLTSLLVDINAIIGSILIIALFIYQKAKKADEKHAKLLAIGAVYIAIGVASIVWLHRLTGMWTVLWLFFVVWATDIGGFFVGCSLRGPKLAPKISPKKTWSGLLGGMLLASLVGYGYSTYMGLNVTNYIIASSILAVVAQIGDLFESYVKRLNDVKDSSHIIPGHGGLFDRVDGLILAAPAAILIFMYYRDIIGLL